MDKSTLTFDEAFCTDRRKLLAEMDSVQPGWWTEELSQQGLESFAQICERALWMNSVEVARETIQREIESRKRTALDRLQARAWLFGHSALAIQHTGSKE